MARRLGSVAWAAVALARSGSELAPLSPDLDLCAAEVRAHVRHGAVLRLEDLLLRRVRLGMWCPELARDAVPRVAPVLRDELGWDATRWGTEEEAFAAALLAWTPQGVR
jgi:glycerol-3-phosphate dehydrogenase